MIKFNQKGEPMEPVLRSDLIFEAWRLNQLVHEAIRVLNRLNKTEAGLLKTAFEREYSYAQPEVGADVNDGSHFYDNPLNAGKTP